MSHITKVKTQLKDAQSLRKALCNLGYNVYESESLFGKSISPTRGTEFTASKKGEVLGFRKYEDTDLYSVYADWPVIKRKQKVIINEITQAYSREKIVAMANSRGYSIISNKINNSGQIEMVIRKVA